VNKILLCRYVADFDSDSAAFPELKCPACRKTTTPGYSCIRNNMESTVYQGFNGWLMGCRWCPFQVEMTGTPTLTLHVAVSFRFTSP